MTDLWATALCLHGLEGAWEETMLESYQELKTGPLDYIWGFGLQEAWIDATLLVAPNHSRYPADPRDGLRYVFFVSCLRQHMGSQAHLEILEDMLGPFDAPPTTIQQAEIAIQIISKSHAVSDQWQNIIRAIEVSKACVHHAYRNRSGENAESWNWSSIRGLPTVSRFPRWPLGNVFPSLNLQNASLERYRHYSLAFDGQKSGIREPPPFPSFLQKKIFEALLVIIDAFVVLQMPGLEAMSTKMRSAAYDSLLGLRKVFPSLDSTIRADSVGILPRDIGDLYTMLSKITTHIESKTFSWTTFDFERLGIALVAVSSLDEKNSFKEEFFQRSIQAMQT